MLNETMLEQVNGGSEFGYHRWGEYIDYLTRGDYNSAVQLYKRYEFTFDDDDKYSYLTAYETITGKPMP